MLITIDVLNQIFNLDVTGILHIGAHDCEERSDYNNLGVEDKDIFWVEAMAEKVAQHQHDSVNIYQAVIGLNDGEEITFNVTNNGQSSSVLEFGSHSKHHPTVTVSETRKLKTSRLDTVIEKYHIPMERVNFVNLDIQGVELQALRSMERYLEHIDYIYTEVNTEHVYKGCDLLVDLDTYLISHGYVRVATKILPYGWGDAFYIRKQF